MENIVVSKPVLLVIAGPNGSGKTSLTKQLCPHKWYEGCEYINPDNIARDVFGDWNSLEAVHKAAELARFRRQENLMNRTSMMFETVLSAQDKIDFLTQAQEAGYFIRLFFISTSSPTINAARVAQRVMQGGHTVPIPKIISRYSKSIVNCAKASKFVNRTYVYDNSVDEEIPRLLFKVKDGKIVKFYNQVPPWAKLIAGALHQHEQTSDNSPERCRMRRSPHT
jgi:predicted ABC-type ATPase